MVARGKSLGNELWRTRCPSNCEAFPPVFVCFWADPKADPTRAAGRHQDDLGQYADAIHARGDVATKGELGFASRTLAAQAMTLDTIFTEMARRMALNMGDYLGAAETYARIALKAQAQSRATLEALVKAHQPREQTVHNVHVNEGGQAVIAEQFYNHGGAAENGKSNKQSDATGPAGASPALLGADPFGNGVPISGGEGAETLQNARRD